MPFWDQIDHFIFTKFSPATMDKFIDVHTSNIAKLYAHLPRAPINYTIHMIYCGPSKVILQSFGSNQRRCHEINVVARQVMNEGPTTQHDTLTLCHTK